MKTIYIKFRHPNDVYAIHPDYDLSPDDFIPPKVCGRCGEGLYLPIELPEEVTIVHPLSGVIRPLPKENPHLIYLSEPEHITIEFTPSNKLSFDERRRLKLFPSVGHVDGYYDGNSWSMLVDDISGIPVKHTCKDLILNDNI